ncbi:Hypothetical predicted protein, partial [Prunus dulcis]
MERERGRGLVNTNVRIRFLARERTHSISDEIESWIRMRRHISTGWALAACFYWPDRGLCRRPTIRDETSPIDL